MLVLALATLPVLSCVAAAQITSPRLLFAQEAGDACDIRYWYEGAAEAVRLARVDECPERLFIDQTRQIVFVVDKGEIRAVRIYPAGEISRTPLPEQSYKFWLDQMTLRPDENVKYKPSIETLKIIGVRYFDDGSLGAVMSLWMPADDEFHYLFRYDDNNWTIVESQWCERWGCDEPKDRLDLLHPENYLSTMDNRSWPEFRMVWHLALMQNDYVISRKEEKIKASSGDYSGEKVEVGMSVDGTSSILSAYISPSEHSDTQLTFSVDLLIDAKSPKNLSKNQCLTSIVGRHILVYEFFRGRFELTDVGTGESVLSNLSTAAWID
jgi:hypothetical protein